VLPLPNKTAWARRVALSAWHTRVNLSRADLAGTAPRHELLHLPANDASWWLLFVRLMSLQLDARQAQTRFCCCSPSRKGCTMMAAWQHLSTRHPPTALPKPL
jgi:hypothetical protein